LFLSSRHKFEAEFRSLALGMRQVALGALAFVMGGAAVDILLTLGRQPVSQSGQVIIHGAFCWMTWPPLMSRRGGNSNQLAKFPSLGNALQSGPISARITGAVLALIPSIRVKSTPRLRRNSASMSKELGRFLEFSARRCLAFLGPRGPSATVGSLVIDLLKPLEIYLTERLKIAIDECDWLSLKRPFLYGAFNNGAYLANEGLLSDANHRGKVRRYGLPTSSPTRHVRRAHAPERHPT
jgi:hypothetical protein